MFGKKKKELKQTQVDTRPAIERLVSKKLNQADNYTDLAEEIIAGNPVAINVVDLDASSANKVLAFLTGVVYALDGAHYKIKENVYIFFKKENLDDGSLDKVLNQ